MRKQKLLNTVGIIGPGRIGQAMGRLLGQAGVRVAFVAARKPAAARRAVRFIGMGKPTEVLDPILRSAAVLLITTSDIAIAEIGSQLAKSGEGRNAWRGKVVLHTCGSLPSAVLRPLKLRGASIGSLHPYQTVPSPQAGVRSLPGGLWAIEGDRLALRIARSWVKKLEGVAFSVAADKKNFYHLSAFMVCPTVVTLMDQAASLLRQAGVPLRIARPMLSRFVADTARNFAELGGRRALTGPVVRGDWATVRRHIRVLRRSAPEFVPVYRSLLSAMLRLAGTNTSALKSLAEH
jgi:predicted short-subunit dehydrogenase-like oxidoreductase (DUF2520 family)